MYSIAVQRLECCVALYIIFSVRFLRCSFFSNGQSRASNRETSNKYKSHALAKVWTFSNVNLTTGVMSSGICLASALSMRTGANTATISKTRKTSVKRDSVPGSITPSVSAMPWQTAKASKTASYWNMCHQDRNVSRPSLRQ